MTPSELNALLEQGALCLAGTSRLARFLAGEYAREQQNRGLARWATPQVLTWPAWLERCTGELALSDSGAGAVWLNQRQEALLWRQVIEASPQGGSILNLDQAAQQAASTWGTVEDWRIPMRDTAWDLSEDASAFRDWARQFWRRCKHDSVQSRAQLPKAVMDGIAAGTIAVPKVVVIAGLLSLTPLRRELAEALRLAGARVIEDGLEPGAPGQFAMYSFASPQEERRAAAEWAYERLRENSAQRVAIIVPDLANVRDDWERALEAVIPRGDGSEPPPYHFSLGRPLAASGLMQSALHLTALTEERVANETASAILLSPHIEGSREERLARAWRSVELRRRTASTVRLGDLAGPQMPALAGRLMEWDAMRRELPKEQTPSRWARQFSKLFRSMGWPGIEPDSAEYQTMEKLRDALSELASLDGQAGAVTARQAAEYLKAIVQDQVFEVENLGQPLQLLGADEAVGVRFDAAWLAGFHDRAWPRTLQPLALVPVSLQRTAKLPGAVPDMQLALARAATAALRTAAAEITVSYARAEGEEPLLASPMFVGDFEPVAPAGAADLACAPVEEIDDVRAPEYAQADAKGGSSLLRDQAQCPFRSFALHRLEAEEFPEAELGLTARERGVMLHAAIDHVWRRLKDLAGLKAANEASLAVLIRTSVQAAIRDCTKGLVEPFDARVREVEQSRLERLLDLWMKVERDREANFTVIGRETANPVEIGGVNLSTRYDRRDRLDDGRLVLIDYKSNAPSTNAWEGERPDEPQIPLYAISTDEPIAALAFGQMKRSDARFKGVAEGGGILPNVKASGEPIAERVKEWNRTLGGLATQYREGFAAVDPKNAKACDNCHLSALCRVNEAEPRGEEDDDDSA